MAALLVPAYRLVPGRYTGLGGEHPAGQFKWRDSYHPFGEIEASETQHDQGFEADDRGFIGAIFDPETGLQYLNARYYDPRLGMFIQPDWWEVTGRGVGTNRFAYSMNDPINKMDPNGHATFVSSRKGNEDEFLVDAVTDDGDLGIYVGDQTDKKEHMARLGETFAWDSFVDPDTNLPTGRIYYSEKMDDFYDAKAAQAAGESRITVAVESRPNGEYDLKKSYPGHEGRPYHGLLLDGKYVTLREAGNMLAGQNAAAQGVDFTEFQKMAGRLHQGGIFGGALLQFLGKDAGSPPNWGEIDYQRTRSYHGWVRGYFSRNPQVP